MDNPIGAFEQWKIKQDFRNHLTLNLLGLNVLIFILIVLFAWSQSDQLPTSKAASTNSAATLSVKLAEYEGCLHWASQAGFFRGEFTAWGFKNDKNYKRYLEVLTYCGEFAPYYKSQ